MFKFEKRKKRQSTRLMDTKMAEKETKTKSSLRFKPYAQERVVHLPVLLSELVAENALVQIINKLVDGLEMSVLESYYSGQGHPPYHPKMLLKVWVYGYCTKIYTCRPLAQKLREDLCFMWLSGCQRPCFKTLSSFRGVRMQGMIPKCRDDLFKQVLLYLVEQGYIDLEDLSVDGSKWGGNNNKHKIIWSKNTARYKAAVLERIEVFLEELSSIQAREDERYGQKDLATHCEAGIDSELQSSELRATIKELNEVISEKRTQAQIEGTSIREASGALSKIHTQLKNEATKLEKYETQEESLAGRNS